MVRKRDGKRQSGDPRKRGTGKVEVSVTQGPPELEHLRPNPQALFCPVAGDTVWIETPLISITGSPGGNVWGMRARCPTCGEMHPVLNAHYGRDSSGAPQVLFPVTAQDLQEISGVIALLEEHGPKMTREEVAQEIEKRLPWLGFMLDELRRAPIMTVIGVLMAAYAVAAPNNGITPEQMQELIEQVRQSPTQAVNEQPVEPTGSPYPGGMGADPGAAAEPDGSMDH